MWTLSAHAACGDGSVACGRVVIWRVHELSSRMAVAMRDGERQHVCMGPVGVNVWSCSGQMYCPPGSTCGIDRFTCSAMSGSGSFRASSMAVAGSKMSTDDLLPAWIQRLTARQDELETRLAASEELNRKMKRDMAHLRQQLGGKMQFARRACAISNHRGASWNQHSHVESRLGSRLSDDDAARARQLQLSGVALLRRGSSHGAGRRGQHARRRGVER